MAKNKIAIIGARNASASGRSIAYKLASDLSNHFVVTSGLAKGIDASAHSGALNGNSETIAVMPFGIDHVYPKENQRLYSQIEKTGLLVSEIAPHRLPDQGMFHLRNRLISMLADGLIVVEAGLKSGTLSTCRVALDLGVEVMVVPGSPIDPRSHGGNALIKNGAPLVESYTDVLEAMGCKRYYGENQHLSLEEQAPLSERETSQHLDTILALLSDNPINIEIVANESNLEMSILLRIISELEVSGKIHKNSNNEIYLSARGP